jgi:hypothetical protein
LQESVKKSEQEITQFKKDGLWYSTFMLCNKLNILSVSGSPHIIQTFVGFFTKPSIELLLSKQFSIHKMYFSTSA